MNENGCILIKMQQSHYPNPSTTTTTPPTYLGQSEYHTHFRKEGYFSKSPLI